MLRRSFQRELSQNTTSPYPNSHGAGASPAQDVPEVEIVVDLDTEEEVDHPWRVILYNDDIHTFDEVILQLIKATGCSSSRAEKFAWQVHTEGKSCVFEGDFEACFRVQGILREIQLVTEIEG